MQTFNMYNINESCCTWRALIKRGAYFRARKTSRRHTDSCASRFYTGAVFGPENTQVDFCVEITCAMKTNMHGRELRYMFPLKVPTDKVSCCFELAVRPC
jgi:hypothetical protein